MPNMTGSWEMLRRPAWNSRQRPKGGKIMQRIMFWIYDRIFGASIDRLLLAQREEAEAQNEL